MSKENIEAYVKYYEDKFRNIGLAEEQIKQAISIAKELALDSAMDSRIREWVWEEVSEIK